MGAPERIAVVGAGAVGLSVAHDIALAGVAENAGWTDPPGTQMGSVDAPTEIRWSAQSQTASRSPTSSTRRDSTAASRSPS